MLNRIARPSLTVSERVALRNARLRNGQCIRCFTSSRFSQVNEGSDEGKPNNSPRRISRRHARAAMVTGELKQMQTTNPYNPGQPNTSNAQMVGAVSKTPGAGDSYDLSTEDPLAEEEDVDNNTYFQRALEVDEEEDGDQEEEEYEGYDDDDEEDDEEEDEDFDEEDLIEAERALRRRELQGPFEEDYGFDEDVRDPAIFDEGELYDPNEDKDAEYPTSANAGEDGLPYLPVQPRKDDFLQLGQNGSIIASKNFVGVIEDRLRLVSEPAADTFRHPPFLAQKMMNKQLVRFESHEEKEAVLQAALKVAQRRARVVGERIGKDIPPVNHEFLPLPSNVQQGIVDRMVAGKYDEAELLNGQQPYKQPVINDVARTLAINGTYLGNDRNRFVRKVQSLLPAAQPAARLARANQAQSKDK